MSHDTVTGLIAAGAAIFGGALKGVWDWMGKRDQDSATVATARIDDGAQIRAELWAEIDKLRVRLDHMQNDLDQSRRGYLDLLAEHTTLKAEHQTLKHEHDALQIRYAALEKRVGGGV